MLIEQTFPLFMAVGNMEAASTSAVRGLELVKIHKDEPGMLQDLFALA